MTALLFAGMTRFVGVTLGVYSPKRCTRIIRSVIGGVIYLICFAAICLGCIWIGEGL